jgi:transcriptional regulator with XRE-family HTH domain
MELKKNLGKRIKEIRKKRGYSQEKLSELVDIEQHTLSYIETGNNFCSAETLERLIKALEVDPCEIFDFSHNKNDNKLLEEINEMLNKNPDKIKEVYRIIKAIVN